MLDIYYAKHYEVGILKHITRAAQRMAALNKNYHNSDNDGKETSKNGDGNGVFQIGGHLYSLWFSHGGKPL